MKVFQRRKGNEGKMAKSSTKDMTVGSPMKLILGFSLPLLFGFLFQQFYSVIDTIKHIAIEGKCFNAFLYLL